MGRQKDGQTGLTDRQTDREIDLYRMNRLVERKAKRCKRRTSGQTDRKMGRQD
jgi:hypothetical protein